MIIGKIYIQAGLVALMFCLSTVKTFGQPDSYRSNLIESLSKNIHKYYVSADLSKKMGDSITYKYRTGGYESTLNIDEFTFEITRDLRRISRDNHITITPPQYDIAMDSLSWVEKIDRYNTRQKKKYLTKDGGLVNRFDAKYREQVNDDMFTYGDIMILPGNIGFVQIFDFKSTSYIKSENKNRITMASVFKYLRNTKAIIIDFRENQGGSTRLAAKFCSYFSNEANAYFITTQDFFRYDSSGTVKEFSNKKVLHTDTKIANTFTKGKAICILTGSRTFSAAELATYKLRQFVKDATIIGDQTKGGGNGYSGLLTEKYYTATIPSEKAYDESNGDFNIEGKGITPDIYCQEDSALSVAYRVINKENLDTSKEKIKTFKKNIFSEDKPGFDQYYPDYVGNYRKASVYIRNGRVYMIYDTLKKYLLQAIAKDLFRTTDFESVRFLRNKDNLVSEIQIKHLNGYLEKFRVQ